MVPEADGRARPSGAPPPWAPPGARGPHDLAIDLGTAFVRVFARGRGLVAEEPSLVRVWRSPLALESVGVRARAPHVDEGASFPVQPLSKGVVRDEQSAGWLLSALLRRAWGLNLARPRVLVCAPTDATAEEIESLRSALRRAGASSITVVPEPLDAIAGALRDVWAALPEETRAEVRTSGLWLTGGGARLRLLIERVREATSVEPRVPEDPLHAVIDGASRMALVGG